MKQVKICIHIVYLIISVSLLYSCQSNAIKESTDSVATEIQKPKNLKGYLGKWKEANGNYFFTLEAREDGKVYFLFKDNADPSKAMVCEIENGQGRNEKDEMVEKVIITPKNKSGRSLQSFFYDPNDDVLNSNNNRKVIYERRE
ncbi:hypothetical protein WG906_18265 [Pedobacter sp. P351]|uniref:hypothetical protein n=1 Tax=Pedobacter superstes TaxID=3133441 RepID=UPI00309CB58E